MEWYKHQMLMDMGSHNYEALDPPQKCPDLLVTQEGHSLQPALSTIQRALVAALCSR